LRETDYVAMVTVAPTLSVGLKDTSTVIGGSLTFTCQGQGQPVPDYTWYINAQPVAGLSCQPLLKCFAIMSNTKFCVLCWL